MHHPFLTSLSISLYLNLHIVYFCSISLFQVHCLKGDFGQQIQELRFTLSRDSYLIESYFDEMAQEKISAIEIVKKNSVPSIDVTLLRMKNYLLKIFEGFIFLQQ